MNYCILMMVKVCKQKQNKYSKNDTNSNYVKRRNKMNYKNFLFEKNQSKKIDCNSLMNISNDIVLAFTLDTIEDKKILQEWINKDSRSKKLIYKLNVVKLLKLDIVIPSEITQEPEFSSYLFNSIIKQTESLIDIRSYIYKIKNTDYYLGIRLSSELKKYYNLIIDSYDESTGLFNDYNKFMNEGIIGNDFYLFPNQLKKTFASVSNQSELKQKLKKETSLKLSEIVIDAIFEDNIYNVKLNIIEILRYLNSIEEKIIDDERITFYKMILNVDSMENVEKIRLFNSLKDKKVSTLLYDDLRSLKNHSYNAIADCLTDFKTNEALKNSELSNKHGVDIYELNGEKFYMLVKSMEPISDKDSLNIINLENENSETLVKRGCYSLIGSDDISVFSGKITYGFNNFNPDSIISIFESDCVSRTNTFEKKDNDIILNENYGTFLVNRLMTPSQIVNGLNSDKQVGYSEIQIAENLKPDFIVAFDKVNDLIINESKKLNIPIVVINRRKYKNRKEYSEPASDIGLMYIDFTSSRESSLRGKR